MFVVDAGDFGKVLCRGAVLLHVFTTGVAEELRGTGSVGDAPRGFQHGVGGRGGILPVVEVGLQTAGGHLLEANHQDAVGGAVGNGLSRHIQAGRAGRAIVVDVVDGDLGHAELVEDALSTGGVAVAVTGDALVDVVVVDLGIKHGLDASFKAQLVVVDFAPGFDELGHPYTQDVGGGWLARHSGNGGTGI